jgi:cellulose synthase/poly-beta-1,6-N-acetylglucosamine synthase-like glycosyltransferase
MTQLESPLADPERLARRSAARGGDEDRRIAPLPDHLAAGRVWSRGQLALAVILGGCVVAVVVARAAADLGPPPLWWAEAAVAVLTVSYLAVVAFGFVGVLAAPGLRPHPADRPAVPDHELPVYTVLVPLYRAGAILRTLAGRLASLEYPADRLQVLLLAETEDDQTRAALSRMALDPRFQIVLVPPGLPRGRAAACQEGLRHARGEFCVVYDPADRPEPGQLRAAVAAFRTLPAWVVCVQAELRRPDPDTSWLTQFSAAELAVNFSLFLGGLALAVPLGSTSNHFRAEALRRLGGWDAHNATPGLDLGVRIPRRGWDVRMLSSVTDAEAPARLRPWLRQRTGWITGCCQTWLVHMRSPYRLWRDLGTRRFLGLQLTLALPVYTALVTPLLWALILVYLVSGAGPRAALFPVPLLTLAVSAAALGSLLTAYALMIGCMQQGLLRAVRTMLLAPAYGALMSAAAYRALFQLLRPRRHHLRERAEPGHWEPTEPLVSRGSVMPS